VALGGAAPSDEQVLARQGNGVRQQSPSNVIFSIDYILTESRHVVNYYHSRADGLASITKLEAKIDLGVNTSFTLYNQAPV